jgi:septal ring factor EnvC (AmiA/AmiB activator)
MTGTARWSFAVLLALWPMLVPFTGAGAQNQGPAEADERARREGELKAIEGKLQDSLEARRRLTAEIAELKSDRAKLNAALVDGAARAHAAEERIQAVEARLDTLTSSESALRGSLEARRDTIASVLAALQRMGRRPPPALLARPDDILSAVRTSMLLGAVLPELRDETASLATDLAELVRLRRSIDAEREGLKAELAGLATEQERVSALVEARQERLVAAEAETGDQRLRAEALAREAKSLTELLDRMQGEAATEAQARQLRQRFAAAAFRDPARLAPKLPFAEAKGTLPKPASGPVLRAFGTADGLGGTMRGLAIGTRADSLVTAPADGWVVFAGPFRSFGRLLIINAGNGYYLLFAGMDRASVEVGQFVLAGEPIGQMGKVASPSAALGTVEAGSPVLYVEFRKDGLPVDPGPWWAKTQSEKVRG